MGHCVCSLCRRQEEEERKAAEEAARKAAEEERLRKLAEEEGEEGGGYLSPLEYHAFLHTNMTQFHSVMSARNLLGSTYSTK